ncbi:DUF3426 domain-containing protein [Cupriavidus sp. DL-D2]|uniref:DUF3426 domain-containing protein n=1 Tax=Cupriavidus sp. DL-D2 TaxID=3144974 RepID=UPI0032146EA0
MAAAKLVTRCPACRTAFRLVADQLRLRQGLVRCGQCDTVFDAREHLIEVPVRTPGAAPTPPSPTSPANPAAPDTAPATATASAVTMAAALAHAERMQDSVRAREQEAPFDPGFDPGYEVPALDSPTTMMSEPEVTPPADEQPATEDRLETESEGEPEGEPAPVPSPEPEPEAEPEPEPERPSDPDETEASVPDADDLYAPRSAPPVPWPILDHGTFDDDESPSAAPEATSPQSSPSSPGSHSSLDPAAAFAPQNPSTQPPSGAYSAKASWPALFPAEAPHAPHASQSVPAPTSVPDLTIDGISPPDAPPPPAPMDVVPSASGFLRVADPTDPEAEAWAAQAKDVIEHDLGVTLRDGTPDAVARETTTRHWLRPDASAPSSNPSGPGFAPDFLRHTRGREQARTPARTVSRPKNTRGWKVAAVVVLAIGAIAQTTYLTRSYLAGSVPMLRPLLEAACAPLGCEVPPWRDLESLRIESSQLQKQDEGTDAYQLAVTLRNQGRATTALPAIELVMTDLQDQLLLRRVLQPAEYLEAAQRGFAATGLRAGSELPVRVRFRTQQAAANYRVLIFYP